MTPERARSLLSKPERACLGPCEFEDLCRTVIREAKLREALETIMSPDMWEQVEGMLFGPDCPDGHCDPLIWLGRDHPCDIARAALETKGDE